VAEIDPIDELEHNESYLLLRDCVFVCAQVFFEVLLSILKDQLQLFFNWRVDDID